MSGRRHGDMVGGGVVVVVVEVMVVVVWDTDSVEGDL